MSNAPKSFIKCFYQNKNSQDKINKLEFIKDFNHHWGLSWCIHLVVS